MGPRIGGALGGRLMFCHRAEAGHLTSFRWLTPRRTLARIESGCEVKSSTATIRRSLPLRGSLWMPGLFAATPPPSARTLLFGLSGPISTDARDVSEQVAIGNSRPFFFSFWSAELQSSIAIRLSPVARMYIHVTTTIVYMLLLVCGVCVLCGSYYYSH